MSEPVRANTKECTPRARTVRATIFNLSLENSRADIIRAKTRFIERDGLKFGVRTVEDVERIGKLCGALPGLANLWLIVTKDTALIAVVGYTELALATRQAAGNTKMYFTFFMVAGLIYLLITLVSQRLFANLEKRVRRGQRKLA